MQSSFSGISNNEPLRPGVHTKHSRGANITPAHKPKDEISIGTLTPEKTQALLNKQIAEKLEKYFQKEGIELKGLQADDFTPEKVSDRILGFVSGRILSEQDSDKQSALMEKARKGIEQGFAEAKEILESLDVLNGKVKEDADSTYDLIQEGLSRLEQQIKGIQSEDKDIEKENTSQVQQASVQSSYSRSENTQVEIITRDGDTVLIDLSKQKSGQSSHSFSQSEEGTSFNSSRSLSASAGISYQVKGDLDDDEQKAIDDLLKEVSKVSDSFFSGDVQKAFKNASKLEFDSEELTRFSLNMDYQESKQVAISTYSNYQTRSQSDTQNRQHNANEQSGLSDISHFIKQMDHLLKNPFALQKFDQPAQGINDLFNGMNQLLHSDEMRNLEKDSSDLLDSLVQQIKDTQNQEHEAVKSDKTENIT